MILDAYIRVSKVGEREGDSFISPEVQREQIERWAALRSVSIARWETDLDRSGTVLARPGLERILKRIERGETGGVVVAYISRLSRAGVVDALGLVARIVDGGGTFASIDLGIDPTTPFGEFALTLMLAFSRMESRRIGENWLIARSAAVDRGVFVGGFVPPGYVKVAGGRLEPDPSLPPDVVRRLFQQRANRESWSRVSIWASEAFGRELSIPTVRNMIANRVYLGEVHGGQGLINRKAHKALVSRALFEKANAVRGLVPARSGNASGLLSGLVRCAGCRYAMKASMRRGTIDYRCKATRRETTERCAEPVSISGRLIEDLVLKRVFDRYGDAALWRVDGSKSVDEAEDALRAAEAELDATLDTRLADALGSSSDRYLELVRAKRSVVDAAQAALSAAQASQVELPEIDLHEVWPDLSLHERRQLLASALDCVFVRRGTDVIERTHFCWHGEAPELPRSGSRWSPTPFDFPA